MSPQHYTKMLAVVASLLMWPWPRFAEAQSQCFVPKYRVLAVPSPGLFNVATNSSGTYYTGFTVDVLFAMARIANFTFEITVGADSDLGGLLNTGTDCFSGGIGQLQSQAIDIFIIPTVFISSYAQVIDFTVPFMRSNYQVIYNTYTGLNNSIYMVTENTDLRTFLQNSKDPRVMAIWANIQQHLPDSIQLTFPQAEAMVKNGGWALFGRTPYIDRVVCQSYGIVAKDPTVYARPFTGFAVQKGSNILGILNQAILQMEENGVMDDLLHKWFPCTDFSCS